MDSVGRLEVGNKSVLFFPNPGNSLAPMYHNTSVGGEAHWLFSAHCTCTHYCTLNNRRLFSSCSLYSFLFTRIQLGS